MVVATFFFSVMSLLVKTTGQHIHSFELVFARSVILVILCAITLRRRGIDPWGTSRGVLILRGVLGFIALNCFYFAIPRLPLADVTVLQFLNPAFTTLIAAIFLSELLGARHLGLVLLSLVGVVLVAQPTVLFGEMGAGLDPLAVGAGVVSAFLSAAAWVVIRRLARTEEPLVIVFYFALVSAVGSAPVVLTDLVLPYLWEWPLLLGIGVVTYFGQLNLTRGMRLEPAGRVAAFGYLQIVFATLWGVIFFGEIPGLFSVAGGILIIGSTFFLARSPEERAGAPVA
jgi:drug/metabolite transporter (DMT)-like permease